MVRRKSTQLIRILETATPLNYRKKCKERLEDKKTQLSHTSSWEERRP